MVDSGGDSMDVTLTTIAATLSALKTNVEELAAQVGEQFKQVREQFTHVDERFTQVDERFKQVDERIQAEGERTRRHFDVVAEHMKAERNLGLDVSLAAKAEVASLQQSNTADHVLFEKVLADHEARLSQLEKKD